MSLRVEWFDEAEDDLQRAPDWRIAAAVDAVVERLARDGVGFLRLVRNEEGPDEMRLYVPAYRGVYALVRRTATTLYVERVIYRPQAAHWSPRSTTRPSSSMPSGVA